MISHIAILTVRDMFGFSDVDESSNVHSDFFFNDGLVEMYINPDPKETHPIETRLNRYNFWSKFNQYQIWLCGGVS